LSEKMKGTTRARQKARFRFLACASGFSAWSLALVLVLIMGDILANGLPQMTWSSSPRLSARA